MKKYFLAIFIFYSLYVVAQPSLVWQHCTGGTDGDQGSFVTQTHDHGFVITAVASSTDGDIIFNHGGDDAMIIRLDSNNNILWQRTYGGTRDDDAVCIIETSDHGFVFIGGTESNDGDVSGNHGDNDLWVVKIDSIGNIQWQKAYGDSTYDMGFTIIQNASGNFVVLGWLSDANWDADYWLLNLDPNGNLIWQKTYGGSDTDWGYQVIQTIDGGYMLSGWTLSNDGDVTNNHGEEDVWLVKTDAGGNLQWQRAYGGTDTEQLTNILQLASGGYVFAAVAVSYDGDVQNNFSMSEQYWVVKTDANGNIVSQKCYGGSDWDEPYCMIRTSDNGFAITGMSGSNDSDVTGNHGDMDCWTLKLDSSLNKQWAVCSGGSSEDLAYGICQLADGDFVLTGYAYSSNGDVSGNHGGGYEDIWTYRLSGNSNLVQEQTILNDVILYPNPVKEIVNIGFHSGTEELVEVIVADVTGRIFFREMIHSVPGNNTQQVNLRGADAGTYFLTLKLKDSIAFQRIVKE